MRAPDSRSVILDLSQSMKLVAKQEILRFEWRCISVVDIYNCEDDFIKEDFSKVPHCLALRLLRPIRRIL